MATTSSQHSYDQLVRQAEGSGYQFESDHPVVYYWSHGREHRDPGADGGPYNQS